ncbi:lactoylglutathione lyase [Filimonas lacunae]|uniref:Lactoylglutathione lyase n=1 Tax=Filimonas lacunae TaxID=477680 RepID=A0A173MMG5_9BACT|nr:VOC family protein [Filimonas lacunae]BAV08843.1 hypothetical protein FLA_4890 [Filimonas lacunae]SIS62632.1 lactoylglutathione lyase [Filimonas lacunae]
MLGLRTVIYRVGDIQKAKEWYAAVFLQQPYFDAPFYVGFNIGGYELGLQPDETVTGDNVLAYWGVNSMDEDYQRVLSLGATVHEAPANVGGEIVVATVKDPWNNVIGFIYNPTFGQEPAAH